MEKIPERNLLPDGFSCVFTRNFNPDILLKSTASQNLAICRKYCLCEISAVRKPEIDRKIFEKYYQNLLLEIWYYLKLILKLVLCFLKCLLVYFWLTYFSQSEKGKDSVFNQRKPVGLSCKFHKTPTQVFSFEISEIFKNSYFEER